MCSIWHMLLKNFWEFFISTEGEGASMLRPWHTKQTFICLGRVVFGQLTPVVFVVYPALMALFCPSHWLCKSEQWYKYRLTDIKPQV